jgi:anthranilate phosphoribosyltransferase
MKQYLETLFRCESLSRSQAEMAMDTILEKTPPREQVAAFLGALQAKEETTDEILGFLDSIKKKCPAIQIKAQNAIDVCGTGGDASNTFNISTAVALVVAASGVPIAKHGNRSVSSQCGSADVLEALGLPMDRKPGETIRNLETLGFGFFFAPLYHSVLAQVRDIRKSIGVKTVFNLLGPLTNPARVKIQLLGLYDKNKLVKIAEVLKTTGTTEAMVVCSDDGLDEISLSAPTHIAHLKSGQIREYQISPEDFGIKRAPREALKGGNAQENANTIRQVLGGEKGPKRDVVVINAGAALLIAGRASNWIEGARLASQTLDAGKGLTLLEGLTKK